MASAPSPTSDTGNITSGTLPTGSSDTKPKVFDEQGAVGKQFTEHGAIGGAIDKIGGPLSKDGIIGKQFTTDGAIGGTVESALGGQKKT